MPRRKRRIPVVFDTNVLIAFHLSTHPQSANSQVCRLWRDQRKLQLVVSAETIAEYLDVLRRLNVSEDSMRRLTERFERRSTITKVKLGAHPRASRDPNDNFVLATAQAGRVKFLVTNDRDLLDLSEAGKRKFKFTIVSPLEFLAQFEV